MIEAIQKTISKIIKKNITKKQTLTILAAISAIGYENKTKKIPDHGLIANAMMPGGQFHDISHELYGVIESIDMSSSLNPGYSAEQTIKIRILSNYNK